MFVLYFGVLSVPGSAIFIVCSWSHDCGHDGSNVEIGPGEHLFQDHVIVEFVLTYLLDSFLHGNSSLVVNWFWLVSVVVGLNKEPGLV